jgi:hypothetical protein
VEHPGRRPAAAAAAVAAGVVFVVVPEESNISNLVDAYTSVDVVVAADVDEGVNHQT